MGVAYLGPGWVVARSAQLIEDVAVETLAERVARAGKLEATEAVTLAARLALRLEDEHARGEPHGRVSPNAILLPNNESKRALLKSAFDAPEAPSYLSPEQLAGAKKVPSDDVWALGAM